MKNEEREYSVQLCCSRYLVCRAGVRTRKVGGTTASLRAIGPVELVCGAREARDGITTRVRDNRFESEGRRGAAAT